MTFAVKRRVIHLAGYDPMSAARFHGRFVRELPRFAGAWGAQASAGPLTESGHEARWTIKAAGPDWSVETEHVLLPWDDLIERLRERPALARWPLGVLALLDFIWSGALWGYVRHGPRYLLFFLFPFVVMALCATAGWLAASLAAPFGLVAAIAAGLGVGIGLLALASRRLPLDHLLDDWIFASDHVRRLSPELAARLEAGRRLIAETPRDTELVVIGHSLGAALAAEMLGEAVLREPEGRAIAFLTVGSSIMKLALHRAAERLRADIAAIAASPRIAWADYSAVNDVINFFRTDPVKALGLDGRSPVIRKASFARMLKPDYYKRIQLDFFRLHCQFISGNDLRAPYDYLMVVAGPLSMEALAARQDGAVGLLGPDGALTPAGREAMAAGRDGGVD